MFILVVVLIMATVWKVVIVVIAVIIIGRARVGVVVPFGIAVVFACHPCCRYFEYSL